MNKIFEDNCKKCFFFDYFRFPNTTKRVQNYNGKVICLNFFCIMNTDKILAKIRSKRQELNYSQEYIATVLQMK